MQGFRSSEDLINVVGPVPSACLWNQETMESMTAHLASRDKPDTAKPVFTVRLGDAFDLVKDVPDNSVDLLITSPPYWGQRTYGRDHNWDILREWESNRRRTKYPTYKWYKSHGGVLGLEPLPDWYISFLCGFFYSEFYKDSLER